MFTYLEGAYTGNKKKVIYCIVALKQLAKLKQIVNDIEQRIYGSRDTAGWGMALETGDIKTVTSL